MSTTTPRTRTVGPPPEPAVALHVDWTRCDGRGLCTELLPELLERDEWGYPVARRRTGLTLEPAELAAARRRGRRLPAGSRSRCPTAAPADHKLWGEIGSRTPIRRDTLREESQGR